MNRVIVRSVDIQKPGKAGRITSFCTKVLKTQHMDNCELSVVFCTKDFIRSLNKNFRGIDEGTDILSFSTEESGGNQVNGDLLISMEVLAENCQRFSVSEEEELKRLLVHGILHLAGQDHDSLDPEEPMLARQEEIIVMFSKEKIF